MDIKVSGSLTKKGLIDLIEKDANQDGYTIIEDSITWDPDPEGELISFELRGMTGDEKENKGLDPRPVPQQITQAITKVIRNEVRKLKQEIAQKNNQKVVDLPKQNTTPEESVTKENPVDKQSDENEAEDSPSSAADAIRKKRREELEEINNFNEQHNLQKAGNTLNEGWDKIPEDRRND